MSDALQLGNVRIRIGATPDPAIYTIEAVSPDFEVRTSNGRCATFIAGLWFLCITERYEVRAGGKVVGTIGARMQFI